MQEIETKVLDVDVEEIKRKLDALGAKEIQNARLFVDWFRPQGHEEGETPWFLRIRTNKEGDSEVTWKSKREFLGVSSTKKEINLKISDEDAMSDLFIEIGMKNYAHQEKDRISWLFKEWQFDLDQYPGMPAYLGIEGKSEESIREAIKLLNLEDKIATPKGERVVITDNYKLDWYNMRF
ncbi:MAG: CYTH domain-containing protein [Candidatus Paceibacterota bacterium]